MRLGRALSLVPALLFAVSCGAPREKPESPTRIVPHGTAPPRPAPRPPPKLELYFESSNSDSGEVDLEKLRGMRFVGMDNGPVPEFHVRDTGGRRFDSDTLVGNQAFVVLFFATWCPVCEKKLPLVKKALDRLGSLTVIAVTVDEPETFQHVPRYLRRHGLSSLPVVRATSYPAFALSYDPFSIVPLVVVVGRNGGLVDFQMGITNDDPERLVKAVKLARTIGPLAPVRDAGADAH